MYAIIPTNSVFSIFHFQIKINAIAHNAMSSSKPGVPLSLFDSYSM